MGGFFGIVSCDDCLQDVFFGVDYHSHLGTRSGGLAAYDPKIGLQRKIHNIGNAPFRSKFEHIFEEMKGISAIGCISDTDPQPMLIRSHLGTYAIILTGVVRNADVLIDHYMNERGGHFDSMTGGRINNTELLAALIDQKDTFTEGIRYAQDQVEGTASILILTEKGTIICARDKFGRLPMLIGKNETGYAVTFESFAYEKLGYEAEKELGPGEIVELSVEGITELAEALPTKRVCSFLWSYYGYPTSTYEGKNVEVMRYKNGEIMAQHDAGKEGMEELDYIGGVPDSGTPHAIGYANESHTPFARAFIKYTPTWAQKLYADQPVRPQQGRTHEADPGHGAH